MRCMILRKDFALCDLYNGRNIKCKRKPSGKSFASMLCKRLSKLWAVPAQSPKSQTPRATLQSVLFHLVMPSPYPCHKPPYPPLPHRTESILFDSGSQILQQKVERLDAKSVLDEEEVARAAALEEVAGAFRTLIKAL